MAINTTYNGYFLPQSMSYDYVRGKRNELGVNKWDYEANEINIDKQRALQNLNDRYSESLNDAYANYLASQGLIQNSNMGQGYQQQYSNQLANQFNQTATELGTSVSEARSQVEANTQARLNASQSVLETQVANLNRVGTLAENYLNYVKTLRNTNSDNASDYFYGDTGLTENATIEDLYARMLGDENGMDTTLAAGYKDIENNAAKSFSQYVNDEMTDKDQDFYNWFLTSGYNDFKSGIKDKAQQRQSQLRQTRDENALKTLFDKNTYKDIENGEVILKDNKLKINGDYSGDINSYFKSLMKNNNYTYISNNGDLYKVSVKNGEFELTDKTDFKVFDDKISFNNDTNNLKLGDTNFKNNKDFKYLTLAEYNNLKSKLKEKEKYNNLNTGDIFYFNGNTYGIVPYKTTYGNAVIKLK